MEWGSRGELHEGVLPARVHPLSELAPAVSCTGRGEWVSFVLESVNKPRFSATDNPPKQQQLYSRVQTIASRFNESERSPYETAARDWRMPYWDWAQRPLDGGPVYMEEFGEEMVDIYGPRGWQRISNPLYSYHFSTRERLDFDFQIVWPAST
ncbi:tyrosinase family protein [Candidatus Bathyarchaeota archaeon]|nr:tyrosinase family protein [Candidatus Bathyarchaeota archaeon]